MKHAHLAAAFLVLACAPQDKLPDPCQGRRANDLVITELMNDPEGIDTGKEYLELYNTTGGAIDLKGLTLYASKLDGSALKTYVMRAGTVPSKAFFALGDVREGVLPGYLGSTYADGLGALANEAGVLGVKCSNTVLDEVKYTSAGKTGRARMLDGDLEPDAQLNDQESKWCDAAVEFTPGSFGSPGLRNASCAAAQGTACLDNGTSRPVVAPKVGELVVSEIMADPAAVADTAGEWLELYAWADLDLNGVEVAVGASKSQLASPSCLRVHAGTHALLARSADAGVNGGLPPVTATMSLSLGNSGGSVTVRAGTELIDEARYGAAVSGVSFQLKPTGLDATKNDEASAYCLATQTYGAGDKGTPGAANSTCPPVVDANSCLDPQSGLARPMVRPALGDLVLTELMANPKGVDDAVGEWVEFLVKTDVDLNGVELANEGSGVAVLSSATCMRPGAGSLVVLARKADPAVNGGLPDPVLGTFGFSLSNSGARALMLRSDAGLLDHITWDAGAGDGISSQLSLSKTDHLLNDDPASFCLTPVTRTYGLGQNLGDGGTEDGGILQRGSPGAANEECP